MFVLFAASEATPYSKTGGLADVCSALPKALSRAGHKVAIVTPYYRCVREYFERTCEKLEGLNSKPLKVRVGKEDKFPGVLRAKLPDSDVDVYFIEYDDYFNREGLYNHNGVDHNDNCERFVFFSRAVLELIERENLDVDVVHANDWQTALVPVFLDAAYKSKSRFDGNQFAFPSFRPRLDVDPERAKKFDKIKSVLTIHNLRHQGRFWRDAMDLTALDWSFFTYDKMEFYGQLNMLKAGVVFSDAITTVSPKYAEEIQTEEYGERLQGVLQRRSADLYGILNGIDTDEWNPAADPYLPAAYDCDNLEGKAVCKEELQKELGLDVKPSAPLFGVVSRLDAQKGLDLIADCAAELIEQEGVQFALLGSGDRVLADRFRDLANRYPRDFAARMEFSVALSHRIEAGADVFLMPSRYEPCGLNQMYSLRYGTLPLVHDVGGLHDSVVNGSDEAIAKGEADGFLFYWENVGDMRKAIDWILYCYRNRKDDWKKMMTAAMKKDLSWGESAKKYALIYEKLIAQR